MFSDKLHRDIPTVSSNDTGFFLTELGYIYNLRCFSRELKMYGIDSTERHVLASTNTRQNENLKMEEKLMSRNLLTIYNHSISQFTYFKFIIQEITKIK